MLKKALKSNGLCYVGQDGVGVLRCPKCDATKKIDTRCKDYTLKRFKTLCECGAKIRGKFEFRSYYRKKVHLNGFYQNTKTGIWGNIIVKNISLMGIRFRCLRKHDIKKGDKLDVTFTSDSPKKSTKTFWVEVVNSPRYGNGGISAVKM
jgi:hypothetical protein